MFDADYPAEDEFNYMEAQAASEESLPLQDNNRRSSRNSSDDGGVELPLQNIISVYDRWL
ncbi:MAG: hypothetical protein MJA83_17500 [Gammaproteobacteria bacterium]|nr:hypothetical protein [Gammaproteobacteria bacterium]